MPARDVLKASIVNQTLLGEIETAATEAAASASAAAGSASTASSAANVATEARDQSETYRDQSRRWAEDQDVTDLPGATPTSRSSKGWSEHTEALGDERVERARRWAEGDDVTDLPGATPESHSSRHWANAAEGLAERSESARDQSREARDQSRAYRDQSREARDQAQAAAAGINTANGSTALRSVLALGADVPNQFRADVGYLVASQGEQNDDGTWTIESGGSLSLDIPQAPLEAYNLSWGFVVLEGDARYITAQARADGSSGPPQIAVPAEGYYDELPPQAFISEGSELDYPGRNLLVEIVNPAGGGAIRISHPVLQWSPRLMVPFGLSDAETRRYRIRRVSANVTLSALDTGKLIVVPAEVAGPSITITIPIGVGEGWHCDILSLTTKDITIAASGGSVVGPGTVLDGQYARARAVRLGTQIVVTGDLK